MTLHIIALEDDTHDFELIHASLTADDLDVELVQMASLTELQAALARKACDVVLIDCWQPGGEGFLALRLCHENHPDVPVIVVSGGMGEEQAISTLKLGATDYVTKSHIARLAPAVRRALREVTERRARRRAEELREQFFAQSPDLLCITDFEGRFLDVNPAWERVLGWTRQELLAKAYVELIHPDDRNATSSAHERVVSGEPLGFFENRYAARDGTWHWLQWSAYTDDHGRRNYAVARDVTERRRLRAELEARVAQQAIMASFGTRALRAKTGVAELIEDAAHLVATTLGTELAAVVELTRDGQRFRVVGNHGWPAHLIVPDGVPVEGTVAEFALRQDDALCIADWDAEVRVAQSSQSREMHVKSAVFVAIPGRERPFGVLGAQSLGKRKFSANDVNFVTAIANVLAAAIERHDSEAALAKSHEHLRQAQKMEAIGQLSGGVAHDFNNLLTAILGYAELAQDELAPESSLHDHVTEVRKAAQRAAELTRKLLAFSRKQVLAPRVIDLNHEIRDMHALFERTLGADIELELSLDENLHPINADPGQIEQVILNLVVNARDAMPRGGRLTIETRDLSVTADEATARNAAPRPGAWVVLSVRDDGCGIDPGVLPRIFEPFFTTKAPGKGTGMGLATVHGIVEQSGGSLAVQSELGRGTTFSIYLAQAHGPVAGAAPQPRAKSALAGHETILVVEDDVSIRMLMEHVLVDRGYEVLVASDGRAALDLARRYTGSIDLVATDLVMPRMNGYQLKVELSRERATTKWLFLSGFATHATFEQRLRDTNAEFLVKPFTTEELLRRVRAVLDERTAAAT